MQNAGIDIKKAKISLNLLNLYESIGGCETMTKIGNPINKTNMKLSSILKLLNTKFIVQKPTKKKSKIILNEAVNFKLKSIFVAIPKTGTTTVRNQIRARGGDALISAPHLNIVQIRDLLYIYLLKKSLGKNLEYPTKSVLSDFEIRKRSHNIFTKFFKFSAVRNPWARAVSLYYRREGVRVAEGVRAEKDISFDTFCEHHYYASDTCRYPTLHLNQLDWLVDESGEVIMDYIYKIEDYENAIKEIKERTEGRIQLIAKQYNKNPGSQSENYRELYTDYTRQLIAKRFEKDIDFFSMFFSIVDS